MIQLTLTDEQAKIVAKACEFYARVKMGQFGEIVYHLFLGQLSTAGFYKRRDEAERLIFEARKHIFPDLQGKGHSYGIGKFEDADKAFDVYQVIDYAMGSPREPYSYYDLPKCEKVTEKRGRWVIHSSGKGDYATNWAECSECHVCGSPQWKRCPVCEAKMAVEV